MSASEVGWSARTSTSNSMCRRTPSARASSSTAVRRRRPIPTARFRRPRRVKRMPDVVQAGIVVSAPSTTRRIGPVSTSRPRSPIDVISCVNRLWIRSGNPSRPRTTERPRMLTLVVPQLDRRVGGDDLVVVGQRRVEPAQARHAARARRRRTPRSCGPRREASARRASEAVRPARSSPRRDTRRSGAFSGTWTPNQSACTLPTGTDTVFVKARPVQSRPPRLMQRSAEAGMTPRPEVARRSPNCDVEPVDRRARREHADLEGVELAAIGGAAERRVGARLDPSLRQVVGHPDREPAVLREHEVGDRRVAGDERLDFGRGRDHLHREERVELVDRLELDDAGRGQAEEPARRRFPASASVRRTWPASRLSRSARARDRRPSGSSTARNRDRAGSRRSSGPCRTSAETRGRRPRA